jgi:hypothetical protein
MLRAVPGPENRQFTLRPAAPLRSHAKRDSGPDTRPSDAVQRLWEKSFSARRELEKHFRRQGETESAGQLLGSCILTNLDDGVSNYGWIGVLHADGNQFDRRKGCPWLSQGGPAGSTTSCSRSSATSSPSMETRPATGEQVTGRRREHSVSQPSGVGQQRGQAARWLLADRHRFLLAGASMGVSVHDTALLARDSGSRDIASHRRSTSVRIKFNYIAPLLAAGAAAVAIVAAPVAAAAPGTGQSCSASGPGTICQSPGNAQINDSPPPVQFFPYGGSALLLGGGGGG